MKYIYRNKVKNSTAAGFEPTRVTPSDFESDALTTRPNCQIYIYKFFNSKYNSI